MQEVILSYYRGVSQQGLWYLGLSLISLSLGYLAYSIWGIVGQGVFIICAIFSGVQLWQGIMARVNPKNRGLAKEKAFKNSPKAFVKTEIHHLEKREKQHPQITNFLTVAFLAGMLCLFLGAFGKGSKLILGVGAALAAEGAIHLILELLSNYRASFYLLRLRKLIKQPNIDE